MQKQVLHVFYDDGSGNGIHYINKPNTPAYCGKVTLRECKSAKVGAVSVDWYIDKNGIKAGMHQTQRICELCVDNIPPLMILALTEL